MIIFDLKCSPQGHVFEAWFGSTDDFQSQRSRGLVSCPICSSPDVEKAPMAPRVAAKGNQADSSPTYYSPAPEAVKTMLAALAAAQKTLLRTSDYVGARFADEARAIHLGESEVRAIHGHASPDDAAKLAEEGIFVAPLLFPVAEPGTEN